MSEICTSWRKGNLSHFEGPCCRCSIDPEKGVYLSVSSLSCSTIYHNAKIVIKLFENVAVSRYLGATVTNDPASITKWRTDSFLGELATTPFRIFAHLCTVQAVKHWIIKNRHFIASFFFFQTHRENSEILHETGKNLPVCILSISLFMFFLLVHLRNKIGVINKWNNYIP